MGQAQALGQAFDIFAVVAAQDVDNLPAREREPKTEQKLASWRRLTLPPDEVLSLLGDMHMSIAGSISKIKASFEKLFSSRAEIFSPTSNLRAPHA